MTPGLTAVEQARGEVQAHIHLLAASRGGGANEQGPL
jgi:hypothetical protein